MLSTTFAIAYQLIAVGGARTGNYHWIHDWVNVGAIQLITHHSSGVIAAVALFWLVGLAVQYLLHDSIMKRIVLWVDEFVLLCLFVYFAYELLVYLYRQV
jgi:hypothetical protein